ncbi:MAG: T9SS type A sorting domain-containing protein [Flavobacteriales bacterium]|nr:T9SS type A sorting domain-containing protein [Flavobacteriales bacterium]
MKYLNFLLAFTCMNIYCQTATIDPTFMPGYSSEYKQYIGEHCIPAPNGKLWSLTEVPNQKIIRLFADGKIDDSYVPFLLPGFVSEIKSKSDGGFVASYIDYPQNTHRIYKFNSDGVLDTNFTSPTFNYPNSSPFTSNGLILKEMVIEDDGKIVIVGNFSHVNGVSSARIVRLNSNGSIDTSFNVGLGFNGIASCIKKYGTDKYIVGGNFTSYNGTTKYRVCRLNYDGSIDNTFNINTTFNQSSIVNGLNQEIVGIGVQSDGLIITSGSRFYSNGNAVSGFTVRFSSTGTRDPGFSNTANYSTKHMLILSDDKLFFGTHRLNSDGTLDTTFSNTGNLDTSNTGDNNQNYAPYFVYNNKIYYNRNFINAAGITRYKIHRRNLDGSFDLTFNPHFGFNIDFFKRTYNASQIQGYHVKVLSDGKFIVIGNYSSYNDVGCRKISRFNYNGELDTTFNLDPFIPFYPSTSPIDLSALSMDEQSDGSLIINYPIYINPSIQYKYVWKLNQYGAYDTSFNLTPGYSGEGFIKVLDDDKFLKSVGGSINRFYSNGTVDPTFSNGFSNSSIFTVQNDNKILVTKSTTGFSPNTIPLARLNSDGSIDSSFQMQPTSNVFQSGIARELSDGKILLTSFSSQIGSSTIVGNFRKFNSDGSPDSSYPATFVIGNYLSMYVLNSDNIILKRSSYSNNPNDNDNFKIINPNTNQTIDTFANVPIMPNEIKFDVQDCDKIIAFGNFVGIDGSQYSNLVRYNLSNTSPVAPPTGNQNQTFTQGQTLSNLVVSGDNIQWYSTQNSCFSYVSQKNSSAQNSINSLLPNSTLLENGVTYYASQTINGVESFYRLPVKATTALSINDNESDTVVYYPNPVTNVLNIESDFLINKYEVINCIGQKVVENNPESNDVTIDFSELSSGMYFVKILSDQKIKTLKIVKN